MILWFLVVFLWLGCTKKKTEIIQTRTADKDVEKKEKFLETGTFISGVFRDRAFPLVGEVGNEWEIVFQEHGGSRRFQAKHTVLNSSVEIWAFPDTLLDPPEYDFCLWDFVDRGFYEGTQRKVIRATCVPSAKEQSYVFAEIHHWIGGSWLLEIHASPDHLLSAKRKGEELLQGFTWSADTVQPAR